MRYLKWVLVAILAALAVGQLLLNFAVISQDLIFRLALPWYPLGFLLMPLWAAILIAFVAGFALAVLLEIGAWYQYTRTIRLQRLQIKGLQDEWEKTKPTTPTN
jgi:hypothetical protein